ncbi:MAG: zinc ribbon domain-containing protein [Thermoplasmatales archaeon]|nr:zinc ribbon domain-containing protein [Thermoplasmatales archaeon]
MKKCPRCGAELNDDMIFCGYCRKRLMPLKQHIKGIVIKEFPSITKEQRKHIAEKYVMSKGFLFAFTVGILMIILGIIVPLSGQTEVATLRGGILIIGGVLSLEISILHREVIMGRALRIE